MKDSEKCDDARPDHCGSLKNGYYLILIYLVISLIGEWTKLSSTNIPQLSLFRKAIPSVDMLSMLARNTDKALFEICLAWVFSFVFAVLFINSSNWTFIKKRAESKGGVITGIKLLVIAPIFIFVLAYPHIPSSSGRYGRFVLTLLENDAVFVWGAGILLMAGVCWASIVVGGILLYQNIFSCGENND